MRHRSVINLKLYPRKCATAIIVLKLFNAVINELRCIHTKAPHTIKNGVRQKGAKRFVCTPRSSPFEFDADEIYETRSSSET